MVEVDDELPNRRWCEAEVTAFSVTTSVPNRDGDRCSTLAERVTTITGGEIHPRAGSGTMAFTNPADAQVEAGTRVSRLELTYTAATPLSGVQLEIDVAGIVLDGLRLVAGRYRSYW